MTVYYVRPTNGSDVAAGTSFATAFKTTQKALDTVAAGDEVRLCKEATEVMSVALDIDGANGTTAAPIHIVAANSTDGAADLDNGRYVIQWDTSVTNCVLAGSSLGDYYFWFDIEFDFNLQATAAAWTAGNNAGNSHNQFTRCLFDGGSVQLRGGSEKLWNCISQNSNSYGIEFDGADNAMMGCLIRDATGDGLQGDSGRNTMTRCAFISNGVYGADFSASGQHFEGCYFYNNTSDGLRLTNSNTGTQFTVVMHNSFVKNGGYGVRISTAPVGPEYNKMIDYNHYWSNTTNPMLIGTAITEANVNNTERGGVNNQTGDPGFTSETVGSEDFKPTLDTSVLYQTGMGPRNTDDTTNVEGIIGALVPDSAAGGGGGGGASIIGSPIIRRST